MSMAISYSLKYQKSNLFHKVFIEKEGEVVLLDKGLRLKGKGANDHGEIVNFSDIKELNLKEDILTFTTFTKDCYTLSNAGTAFNEFAHDFFKFRNEFILGALFLKQGDLVANFDCAFERTNPAGKMITKGQGIVKIFSEGIVVVPELNDSFLIPFSFLTFHDFDEDEYTFKCVLDSGITIMFSRLENEYESFQEKVHTALGLYYDKILREMINLFMDFGSEVIVKLAKIMKNGSAVSLKAIKKIDKALADKIMDLVLRDEVMKQSLESFLKTDDDHAYVGIRVINGKKDVFRFSLMFALPEKNTVSCTTGYFDDDMKKINETLFFKIIMERGNAEEKISHKILEINQSLVLMNFILDPLYRDKKEMRRSIYKMAVRKLPFLRILRKSFVASLPTILPNIFAKNLDAVFEKAKILNGQNHSNHGGEDSQE